MEISPPERFQLAAAGDGFSIVAPGGGASFRGPAACRCPKLYIVSSGEEVPIYIGATVQSMRTRLRQGWDATGVTGYYGYRWRTSSTPLSLDIFYLRDCPETEWQRQLETVEAEVAFLVRCAGQWPLAQTEIHFYPSDQEHREIARKIADHYSGLRTKLAYANGDLVFTLTGFTSWSFVKDRGVWRIHTFVGGSRPFSRDQS